MTSVRFSTRSFCSANPTKCLYDLKYLLLMVSDHEAVSTEVSWLIQDALPSPLIATQPWALTSVVKNNDDINEAAYI